MPDNPNRAAAPAIAPLMTRPLGGGMTIAARLEILVIAAIVFSLLGSLEAATMLVKTSNPPPKTSPAFSAAYLLMVGGGSSSFDVLGRLFG